MSEDELSGRVIGAAIEVHRHLGPGLLESIYQKCLEHELTLVGIPFDRQVSVPIHYKGVTLAEDYRLDFLIDGRLVVELKCVAKLLPIHEAQVLTYLRLTGCHLGLLINFHVPALKHGIRRLAL